MLTVIAHYAAKPGRGDEVAAILRRHVAATLAEQGCVAFVATRSIDEPDKFILFEQYVDDASFESHRRSPHFERYVDNGVVPLLENRTWARYLDIEPAAS